MRKHPASLAGRARAAAILAVFLLPASGLAAGSWAQTGASGGNAGPAAGSPPAAGPMAAAPAPAATPAAESRGRANDDMDRLRREIRLLTELREAQKALTDWNRLRVAAGEPAAKLDPALCGSLEEWCRALPGTFGKKPEGDTP